MDASLERIAAFLHALQCEKAHAIDMLEIVNGRNPELCYYFLEQNVAEEQCHIDTAVWKEKAEALCQSLGHNSEDSLRILTTLLTSKSELERLFRQYPSARGLAQEILFGVSL